MTTEQTSQEQTPIHGKPAILFCGITGEILEEILIFSQQLLPTSPFGVADTEDLEKNIEDIFENLSCQKQLKEKAMPPTIIFSGLPTPIISHYIDSYRAVGLPQPLWGSRTPTTDKWTLKELLLNYLAELKAAKSAKETKND